MKLCLDVHYEEHAARTACAGFEDWGDARAALELVLLCESPPEPYEPGQFYKRELPHLLRAIERVRGRIAIDLVIVDGHVWLEEGQPGLGAHLHVAFGRVIPVIGVAKSSFRGGVAIPVLRGRSVEPLFVSAAGIEARAAADLVRTMHGLHRIPSLLKRVDGLARGHALPNPGDDRRGGPG